MNVILCTATPDRPYQQYLDACLAEKPLLDAAGINCVASYEVGSPYISWARAEALRKALDAQPDAVVFIDHDMSWKPGELLRLIQTPGDVIAGTYRFKKPEEHYMGNLILGSDRKPIYREDGCLLANWVPAGFLKLTAQAIHDFAGAYPELMFGARYRPHIDLFNHGAHDFVWYGEDYAFSRRWNAMGRQIWLVPDLKLDHNAADGSVYPGDYAAFLAKHDPPSLKEAA